MNIFIDCEWNDWQGDLISMALVSECGREFYEVLHCWNPSPWIEKNVMPNLAKAPIDHNLFQKHLSMYLGHFVNPHIIADWPEDISHFCKILCNPGGVRFGPDRFTCEVRRDIGNKESRILHNALEDARALKRSLLFTASHHPINPNPVS